MKYLRDQEEKQLREKLELQQTQLEASQEAMRQSLQQELEAERKKWNSVRIVLEDREKTVASQSAKISGTNRLLALGSHL